MNKATWTVEETVMTVADLDDYHDSEEDKYDDSCWDDPMAMAYWADRLESEEE